MRPEASELNSSAAVPSSIQGDEFACDTRNLPYQVLRAHQRALSMSSLPSRARRALAAIALTVSVEKPLNSVFARRPYLAMRAGLSERTWYRAEKDLIAAELIRVANQTRKALSGLYGGAYIYLSEDTARKLGFLTPVVAQHGRPASVPVQDASSTEAQRPLQAERPAELPSSLAQPTATVAARPIYRFYQSPLVQKRQPGELPQDVAPLLALGFNQNYIWKLMKLARTEHGKLLGDVVTVAGDLLRKANSPRAYLWTLLRSATDFGYQARAMQIAQAKRAQQRADSQRLEDLQRRLAGQVFYDRDASKRYEISSDGSLLTSHDADENAPRTNAHGWIAGFSQALNNHKLLPASDLLDRAFMDRLAARPMHVAPALVKASPNLPRTLTAAASAHLSAMAALVGVRSTRPRTSLC